MYEKHICTEMLEYKIDKDQNNLKNCTKAAVETEEIREKQQSGMRCVVSVVAVTGMHA